MPDTSLSKEQISELLQKLATDDAFRSRFEKKPAAALVELGVAHETVVNLPGACLCPRKLAGKSEFRGARLQLAGESLEAYSSMLVPTFNFENGSGDASAR